MYLLQIEKFGIKKISCTLRVAKLHREMTKELEKFEIGLTKKEIQTIQSLSNKLRKIDLNQSINLQFRKTKVKITKIEFIKK